MVVGNHTKRERANMSFFKALFGSGSKPSVVLTRDQALTDLTKYWAALGTDNAKKIESSFARMGVEFSPFSRRSHSMRNWTTAYGRRH